MGNYGTGLDSSIGWGQEASFNAGNPTINRWLPHLNDTINRGKKVTQAMGLRAGNQTPYAAGRRIATREAKGNVVLEVPNQGFGLLLQNMLGTANTSNSGSVYTQTHTLGSLRGSSLACQIGRPSTDGTINPFTYTGGKIVDWELTIADNALLTATLGLDFADEITLANAPAQPTITTVGAAGSTTYGYRISAVLSTGETSASATKTIATGNATLSGTNYNQLTWTAVSGASSYKIYGRTANSEQLLGTVTAPTVTYNDQGGAPSGQPIGPQLTTPSYTSSVAPFSFTMANTLTLNGSPVAAVKKFTIKPTNPSKTDRFYLGSAGVKAEQVGNGYRLVNGTIDAEFVSLGALYAAFAADSLVNFDFKVAGDYIASTSTPYSLELQVPAMYLDGDTPNITGPDILVQQIPFTGLVPSGGGSPITAIYVTSDTAY